jgi:peptide subunit release factor 1 (eRF1)
MSNGAGKNQTLSENELRRVIAELEGVHGRGTSVITLLMTGRE